MKLKATVIAGLIAAIVISCGDDAMGSVMMDAGNALAGMGGSMAGAGASGGGTSGGGGMLADAGQIIRDAGEMLVDAGMAMSNAGHGGGGGSDASAQESPSKSGTRIEIRQTVQSGMDGTRYAYPFASYYDTKLKSACSLNMMSDSTKRCTPTASAFTTTYFSDANCQTRLAYFFTQCAQVVPPYFSESIASTGQTCASNPSYIRVYHAGAEYSGNIYSLSGTTCLATTRPATWRYFALGSEMASSEFVEFSETSETL